MSAADDAYRAAERLIAEAKRTGAEWLSFDREETRALEVLPPGIGSLDALLSLGLSNTGVRDLSPLAGLTALIDLWLDGTRMRDLSPLASLTALRRLTLAGTGVSDLSPLAGLTALTDLSLQNTGASDISPLAGLTALTALSLDNTNVSDLRPLRSLRATLVPSPNALTGQFGIRFAATPATRADLQLAEIAGIMEDHERTRRLFDYLETWEPPADPGGDPAPDDLLPVGLLGGRLEIAASLPTEAERDERLKRVLHERLQSKAPELAQAAGNRFSRLAARARALVREVERPFEGLDMLLIHMEVDDLSASLQRGAERDGEEAFTPDVADALSDVVRIGPGLTLDHPDVELLEDRKRRYAADPPAPETKAAHDELSKAASEDEAAIGDNLRRLEGGVIEQPDSDAAGAVQVAVHRNMVIRIARVALGLSGAVVVGAAGSGLWEFVSANWPAVRTVAAGYGPAFLDWFLAAISQVQELAGLAANIEMRPIRRPGKDRGE